MRTSELDSANRAFKVVEEVKGDEQLLKKFSSYVKSAPTMVLTNGLAQSLAFWFEKSGGGNPKKTEEKAYRKLLDALDFLKGAGDKDLLYSVCNKFNAEQYKTATAKVLIELRWLKRFASAEFNATENAQTK